MENTKATSQPYKLNYEDYSNIVAQTISGLLGGMALGSLFGMIGLLIGGLLAVYVIGYTEYEEIRDSYLRSNDNDINDAKH